jgi:hypothetical protein
MRKGAQRHLAKMTGYAGPQVSMDHRVKPGRDGLSTRHCAGMARRQPEHPLPQLQKSAADAL